MQLDTLVSTETQTALIEAFKNGYETPCENFNEFVGHNGNTFGFELHHTIKHAIAEKAEKSSEMKVLKQKPGFLLKIGKLSVSFYRVGRSTDDKVENAFPLNKSAGLRAEKSQLAFDFDDSSEEQNEKHVIVHIGNATDGLLGLYLCEVGKTLNGVITEWKSIYTIWELPEDNQDSLLNNVLTQPVADAVEVMDETVLTKREVKVEKGRN